MTVVPDGLVEEVYEIVDGTLLKNLGSNKCPYYETAVRGLKGKIRSIAGRLIEEGRLNPKLMEKYNLVWLFSVFETCLIDWLKRRFILFSSFVAL